MKLYDNIFLIVAIAMTVCSSCEREPVPASSESNLMSEITVGSNGIDTRCSAEIGDGDILLSDMPYPTASGDTLYISAFLSDMEDSQSAGAEVAYGSETKGAPINSNLFGTYSGYDSFVTRVYPATGTSCYVSQKNDNGDDSYTMSAAGVSYTSGKWAFDNQYYWPSDASEYLYFLSVAPASVWSDGHVSNTAWDASTHKFSFTYKTLVNATDSVSHALAQKDLLVAYNKQCKDSYSAGVHVDFRHACVGVRFIMGDIYGKIASMSLSNFYNSATITLEDGSVSYSDYSDLGTFTQQFDFETNTHADMDPFDETEYGTKTFMVLPQDLVGRTDGSVDADLQILAGNGALHPDSLSFRDMTDPSKGGDAKLGDWSSYAGKIITFRVSSQKANNVSVAIDDEVEGLTKKNIVITNDGKSDIMIRVQLVGNWLNSDGQILASWNESNPYGTFTSANGFPDLNSSSLWKKGADGFYYYKKYLPGQQDKVVSQNLFDTFTVTSKPEDSSSVYQEDATKMKITTMELDILVQAVVYDADLASFKSAWGSSDTELLNWIGSSPASE